MPWNEVDLQMTNIIKGMFALPLAVAIVCAAIFVGTVILMAFTLLAALVAVAVPFLLKLAALSFVIFGTLWLLGAVVTAVQASIKSLEATMRSRPICGIGPISGAYFSRPFIDRRPIRGFCRS